MVYNGDPWAGEDAEWHLHLAYTSLLSLAETLGLPRLCDEIAKTYEEAKQKLTALGSTPDSEPYSLWAVPARRYVRALQMTLLTEPSRTITRDLESILRASTYSITDRTVFTSPPRNEADVHRRVEAVLRCVFPAIVHKPRLAKPIKNFEPDTGIPTIETLIEFKYLSQASQVATVADEILADTRGYTSKEWKSFIYAIYETSRFRSESEWMQLLRHCEVPSSTSVIVLSGDVP
jgi:hypothetical protein